MRSDPIGAASGNQPLSSASGESPERVRELAHEFEAMFLAQMLKQMRQSLVLAGGEDEPGDGFGRTAFVETFDAELARHLSAAGGIGIADVIVGAYEGRAADPGASEGSSDGSAGPEPAEGSKRPAVLRSGAGLPLPLTDPVSSRFGWRRDPFTGEARFHRGVDVKAAYGRQVPSASEGTVVFAGRQGGYGLTVVVEHDSGIRTRYAHLSELAVRQGDVVRRGQDLGKVGATGRATGAHLHFEVIERGTAVDPEQSANLFVPDGEFKRRADGAD